MQTGGESSTSLPKFLIDAVPELKRRNGGESEVSRMTVAIPWHRERGSKDLRIEVGVRWTLPLRFVGGV